MNIKKPLLVAGVASTIAVGAASGVGVVSAATNLSDSSDPTSSLVDKIATKFNLNKDDVKAVFAEDRSEREAAHQKHVEETLTQAVTDGKLTSSQKDQILAKWDEIKTYHDSIKDKPRSEQRTLMKTKMDELKTWAEQNNIPSEYLRVGGPHGGGPGGPDGPPEKSDSSTNTN